MATYCRHPYIQLRARSSVSLRSGGSILLSKAGPFLASGEDRLNRTFGRGGGDRKLNPLSQVLSCQRRSTAALLPIGVKWCQIPRTAHDRSVLATHHPL